MKMGEWTGLVAAMSGIPGLCVPLSQWVTERHLSYSSEFLQGQRFLTRTFSRTALSGLG